jgi:hypothetical protein
MVDSSAMVARLVRRTGLVLAASLLMASGVRGGNVEAGFHAGLGTAANEDIRRTDVGPEFGVWLILWPSSRIALAADWGYLPREEFQTSVGGAPVGERDRNRQHVDLTLQYHFGDPSGFRFFVEAGGGRLWNNRDVDNPTGTPAFEWAGKESTMRCVWTFGGGMRKRIAPHLHWIGEFKVHNPQSDTTRGVRVFTGIAVSWK